MKLTIISYYMPVMLSDIGITSSSTQLLLNALNTVTSFLSGIVGSFFVDRWGRRSLFLWATLLTGLCYIPLNVIASQAANGAVSNSAGYVFIVFIFLYGVFFSFGCECPVLSYPGIALLMYSRRDSAAGPVPG